MTSATNLTDLERKAEISLAQYTTLRQPLPPKPEWFDRELENIRQRSGFPLFRCVNPQEEFIKMNGWQMLKHPHKTLEYGSHVSVYTQYFKRKHIRTGDWKIYHSREQAKADTSKELSKLIEPFTEIESKPLFKSCWVIEGLEEVPSNTGRRQWEAARYHMLPGRAGILQTVDLLGEYPKDGTYAFIMDVINAEGIPIEPSRGLLRALRERVKRSEDDPRTIFQRTQDEIQASTNAEKKLLSDIHDMVYEQEAFGGIVYEHAEISKPISQILT